MAARDEPELSNAERAALVEVLDDSPLTRAHWKVWLLSALGVFLDGFDLFIIAVALPLIQQTFSPGPAALGLIAAAALVGAVAGAIIFGRVADRFGRKPIYVLDLALFIVFSGLCAVAWNPAALIVFRFLLGVAIGADYPISSSYIAEFIPTRVRGRMLVAAFSWQAIGSLTGAAVGLLILFVHPDISAWRWMLAAGVLPALAIMLTRTTLPESPRWCMAHHRWTAAKDAVAMVASRRAVLAALAANARSQIDQAPATASADSAGRGYRDLLSPFYRGRTLLTTLPWLLMDVCLYGVGFFTPTVLAAMAFTGRGSFIGRDIASTEGSVFLDVFLVIGFAFAIWLIERWGRMRLQVTGFAGMTAGLVILATAAAQAAGGSQRLALIFLGFALFNLCVNMGPNATTYLLPSELFPTGLRASAAGVAAATGKLGAATGVFFLPILKANWGLSSTLAILALASLLGLLVTRAFAVETRGQSLEALGSGEPSFA